MWCRGRGVQHLQVIPPSDAGGELLDGERRQARVGGVLPRQGAIGRDRGDPRGDSPPVDVSHEGVDVGGGVRAEVQVVRVLVHVEGQDRGGSMAAWE